MSMVLEILGISPLGSNGIPAMAAEEDEAAFAAGKLVMELLRRVQSLQMTGVTGRFELSW
jgi:dihydroxy-acid dehydratase